MQALRVEDKTAELKIRSISVPSVGPQDVLIKVEAASMTVGIGKLIKMGLSQVPSTVGHEAAGTVAAVGDEVTNMAKGARVRMHPVLSCRKCHYCTIGQEQMCHETAFVGFTNLGVKSELYDKYHDGSMAEYVRAPYWLIDSLPDNVSFEVGAKIHDIATALRVLKLAELKQDATIVLTAPTGMMGVLTLRLARHFPIKKIILVGRSKERLESIRSLTTVHTEVLVLKPDEVYSGIGALVPQLKPLAPEGIDAILDYIPCGNAISQILPALRVGGTLMPMGGNSTPLTVPLVMIMNRCWRIVGSRANGRVDVIQVLKWLTEGELEIEDLITHRFSISETEKAMEVLESRSEPVWLSVFNFGN